jgi:hypothetical protein
LIDLRSRIRRTAGHLGVALLLAFWSDAALCSETANGPTDNSGFVNVATAPATTPSKTVNIPGISARANPVVAPDGTVYVGTLNGKLLAFKPDGTPAWNRDVGLGESIVASPAIGSDGTIYVLSVSQSTDHRVNPPVKRVDTTLHRFTPGGGYLGKTVFPDHNGGTASAAWPNLWRFNGDELVIVPAVYRRAVGGGIDIRLLAFSTGGAIVADQRATSTTPDLTSESILPPAVIPLCLVPISGQLTCAIEPEIIGQSAAYAAEWASQPLLPGVGIFHDPQGGTPWILLSDDYHELLGFTFSGGAFVEAFRIHDPKHFMRSAPTILPDKHTIIGLQDAVLDDNGSEHSRNIGGALFAGPNQNKVAPITNFLPVYAAPTRLANGRTVLIEYRGQVAVLNGRSVVAAAPLDGGFVGASAASRTHLFVSTETAFLTLDPGTLAEVGRLNWDASHGASRPVIGPQGHVYVTVGNTLYVFPPGAAKSPFPKVVGTYQGPTPSLEASQEYPQPLTTNGNRLFACEKLDGDDCGKGDYNTIALAFCQKMGFAEVSHLKVDSKKVKAETLDGRFCSKNKCKVFDEIDCANN